MKGGAKPTEKLLLFYKLSFEAEAKTLSLHSASKRSFSKPVSFAGLLPAPAPRGYFLMKRKYPKIHKEPVGSLTSNRRGSSPFDSPDGVRGFCDKRGEVSRSDCRDYGRCKNEVLYHVQTARLYAVGELLWYFLRKYSLINMLYPRLPWILQAYRSKHRCQTGVPVQMACSGRIHQQPL